jgi:hypothetical protein
MSAQATLQALSEQVECCQKLAKLAQMQHEHISHGRVEQLLEVLKTRQQVVERMSACERIVGPAKKQWGEFVGGLDETCRAKAEALLVESRSLLEQITAADRDDALVLQQRRLNIGKEIRQTSSARQVHRMYGAAAYGHRPPRMDLHR